MIVLHYCPHFRSGALAGRMWCAFDTETGEAIDYQRRLKDLEDDLKAEGKTYAVRTYHRSGGYTDRVFGCVLDAAP